MAGGISMLGRRQVAPMRVDDPVRRHIGGGDVRTGGGCPPPEGNQEAGRVEDAGQVNKYVKISDRA